MEKRYWHSRFLFGNGAYIIDTYKMGLLPQLTSISFSFGAGLLKNYKRNFFLQMHLSLEIDNLRML